ncbi:hypothetical protein MSTE_01975 [Mycobacteroides stephanolepidis]|uniref:Uncharacterized protein n=1 Tax=[Mycobacterium] stephanolepidis TaxID=1520670 RepID=A0A1Z4EWG8_9MYCO|nr:hypothetical protein MSTE_01975 [[Mycobacterium] stephanolepidis]
MVCSGANDLTRPHRRSLFLPAQALSWSTSSAGMHFIAPGEPWRNGYRASSNSRIPDVCLNTAIRRQYPSMERLLSVVDRIGLVANKPVSMMLAIAAAVFFGIY